MWFKLSDDFCDSDKHAEAGKEGRGLWVAAAAKCAQSSAGGYVSPGLLKRASQFAETDDLDGTVRLLVRLGLWHDSRTVRRCDKCEPIVELKAGHFYFHDWTEHQPTKDEALIPAEKLRWRRKQQLKADRRLCELIVARDGNVCRYCAVRVNWKDRRGATGATYDHVDPDGDNSFENVVVACRRCNGEKRDRTPAEWVLAGGRQLRPAPDRSQHGSGLEPDSD
jgi:hypothetical protein